MSPFVNSPRATTRSGRSEISATNAPTSYDDQLELPLGAPGSRLEAAFREFDGENPHIYVAFRRFTLEAVRAGRAKLGAKLIWERIRWFTAIESKPEGEYRLNNNWTAYYARKFMREHPEHAGLFETRSVVE